MTAKSLLARGVTIVIDYPIAKLTFRPSGNSAMMHFLEDELDKIAAVEMADGNIEEMSVRLGEEEVAIELRIDQARNRLDDDEANKKSAKVARKIASTISSMIRSK